MLLEIAVATTKENCFLAGVPLNQSNNEGTVPY